MHLPNHGCYIDAEGNVQWMWANGNPDTEFDALPPRITRMNLDGTIEDITVMGAPDWTIIDLTAVLDNDDMIEFQQTVHETRFRTVDGKLVAKRVRKKGTAGEYEEDHTIMQRLRAR